MQTEIPAVYLERCSQAIEAKAGLHYPPERWHDLARMICATASDLGYATPLEAAKHLGSDRAEPAQIDELVARLTIGETYFFRDPRAFAALEEVVLPELIQRRRPNDRRLRIWSAGCCTGEEPYSIAITLSRALHDLADWDVTILATDITPQFLQKAEAGIYSRWSFRGTPDALRDRYFRRVGENRFELSPAIRKLVNFATLNLAQDVYPSLLTNTNAMDVIFCRNVLMYFSPECARQVAGKLHRALVPEGWLFPAGTEASRALFEDFAVADLSGVIAYRKMPRNVPPMVSQAEPAESALPPPEPAPAEPEISPEDQARLLANEGRLDEALAACDTALATDKLTPSFHYLRGLILEEKGAHAEAAAALRNALYLDDSFVLAHFALGNLLRRLGRDRDGARCFENARMLLRNYPPEAVLPHSDGLTAGRLLATLQLQEEPA